MSESTSSVISLTVPADAAGERIDRWLSGVLDNRSRSEVQRWLRDGRVRLNNAVARAKDKVEADDVVAVDLPPAPAADADAAPQAEDIPLDILYEDADLLVINKPAGMVVHPAPGHQSGTLVNAVLHHAPDLVGVGGVRRPGIVHRLDRETSGVIVVAKNDRAHRDLQQQFKERSVEKRYLALVEGRVDPPAGRIDAPLGRHPVDRKRQAILPPHPVTGESKGRNAVTDYRTIGVYQTADANTRTSYSLLRIDLHTGRTHQIRVHLAWRRHPIVGDTVYGFRRQPLLRNRHFLHAHQLTLRLPSSAPDGGEQHTFTAPLPGDLQSVLNELAGEPVVVEIGD